MPWKESSKMDERMSFVVRLRGGERMSELCPRNTESAVKRDTSLPSDTSAWAWWGSRTNRVAPNAARDRSHPRLWKRFWN